MTDDRIDALLRKLEVSSRPDDAFVAATSEMLRLRARAARVQDRGWLGRLRRDLASAGERSTWLAVPRRILVLAVVGLLILGALVAALFVAGAPNPSLKITNGPLVLSAAGQLRTIDIENGMNKVINIGAGTPVHASRSPDGLRIAFWEQGPRGDRLIVTAIDGQDPHEISTELLKYVGPCIDTWSSDSRFIASEVKVSGVSRILVADSVTGTGRLITPPSVAAHCPLWSPDGRFVAFSMASSGTQVISIVGSDGVGMRQIGGDLGGFSVSGPDTWSPDGIWIYFDASEAGVSRVFRANVTAGTTVPLSGPALQAYGPASSPDGTMLAFMVARKDGTGLDLYVSNSDGRNSRRLLEHATNDGWSSDGRYILSRWTPPDAAGGLVIVTPEGKLRVVATPATGCPADASQACDLGWGEPRP